MKELVGNIITARAEALVNTVNLAGVMGKGIALDFKKAYPDNFTAYARACASHSFDIGKILVHRTHLLQPKFILNFPTKRHWREKTSLEYITSGLKDLARIIQEEGIRSIAVPPLGCGLGGLNWRDVRPLIISTFENLPDVELLLYVPGHATTPVEHLTEKPAMTQWKATVLGLIQRYSELGYEVTHQEIQKLLYFLGAAGNDQKTPFTKEAYGPYNYDVVHGLRAMEGHYIDGFQSEARLTHIRIRGAATAEAESFLNSDASTLDRISRVSKLIDGFETPAGLELLATVHWVCTKQDRAAGGDLERTIALVYEWNERKRAFSERDITIAWHRLREMGWIQSQHSQVQLI